MFGLERMVDTYLLGFALVWVAVLIACLAAGSVGRFRHSWDRAFKKELRTNSAPACPRPPGPPTTPPAPPSESHRGRRLRRCGPGVVPVHLVAVLVQLQRLGSHPGELV